MIQNQFALAGPESEIALAVSRESVAGAVRRRIRLRKKSWVTSLFFLGFLLVLLLDQLSRLNADPGAPRVMV